MNSKLKGLLLAIAFTCVGYFFPVLVPFLPSPQTFQSAVAWEVVPYNFEVQWYE